MAEPQDYLLPGRPAKLSFGFDSEYLQIFKGFSELPLVDRRVKTCKIHFLDELSVLSSFKLSGGQLQLNIRADRYIWGILDEIYEDYFDVIATCDTDESWTGGSSETTNHRGGDGARKVTSTAGAEATAYTEPGSPFDLSGYASTDYIDFFCYVDDAEKIENVEIRLETTAGVNYFYKQIGGDLINGWNELHILKSAFSETGSPNWNSVARITLIVDASDTDTIYCIFDEIRITDWYDYPQRYFDIGLQTILVAWWAGNTALYEIKIACNAEGARFYADEYGKLHFENRQHYQVNSEHKVTVWGFEFDRATDLEYPKKETDLINKVVVRLKPRKVVDSAEEIWLYGFVPSIAAGATRTIWAALADPCPTTTDGIIQPVATTDYTANTQEDGLGDDKTSEISIVITRFANAVMLEVTNNDAGTVYLTFLRLRGTPAKESDEITIVSEDATSIETYGEHPAGGLVIENKYLADETYAQTRADQLIDWYKDPKTRIVLKARSVPQLQLGDMITIVNEDILVNYLMRVTWLKSQYGFDGLNQEIHCRSVAPQETLTYFEIGVSEIGGTDVIAP